MKSSESLQTRQVSGKRPNRLRLDQLFIVGVLSKWLQIGKGYDLKVGRSPAKTSRQRGQCILTLSEEFQYSRFVHLRVDVMRPQRLGPFNKKRSILWTA